MSAARERLNWLRCRRVISPSGDQGADPNQLVRVTDMLRSTTLPLPGRSRDGAKLGHFTILRTAGSGEVFRGLDWVPAAPGE